MVQYSFWFALWRDSWNNHYFPSIADLSIGHWKLIRPWVSENVHFILKFRVLMLWKQTRSLWNKIYELTTFPDVTDLPKDHLSKLSTYESKKNPIALGRNSWIDDIFGYYGSSGGPLCGCLDQWVFRTFISLLGIDYTYFGKNPSTLGRDS